MFGSSTGIWIEFEGVLELVLRSSTLLFFRLGLVPLSASKQCLYPQFSSALLLLLVLIFFIFFVQRSILDLTGSLLKVKIPSPL